MAFNDAIKGIKNKFNIFFSPEMKDVAERPIKKKVYTNQIGLVADPTHPNPNIQERCIILDADPDTVMNMLGDNESASGGSGLQWFLPKEQNAERHGTPTQFSIRNIKLWWPGVGSTAGGSVGGECYKCADLMKMSEAHEVYDASSPTGINYVHNTTWGGCTEHPGTQYGARRRSRKKDQWPGSGSSSLREPRMPFARKPRL